MSTQAPHARQIIHKTDRIPTIDTYKVLGSCECRGMGGLLLAPAKQRVTMTAMYANYIKHHCTYMQLKPFIQLLLNWEAPSQLNYILREVQMNIL